MDSRVYLLLTLAGYAVGAFHALLYAVFRRSVLTTVSLTATLLGFVFHTAALSQRWTGAGHYPAVGLRDGASLLAWAIVLVFLLVYVTTRVDAAGLFAYPFAFALVFIANLTPPSERADPVLRSLYLPIHLFLAVFGYGALFAAFTMGVLYLFQERELLSRSPGRFYCLIPSLERSAGAGKSSIAKLIARFYEFQQGRLLVDGHDIRTLDLAQYRRQLGIVSQVPFLFSGTVADNIRYAAPDATDSQILAMARRVGDGEWLETLPNGIETEVGERGARLSMGQRQLVALMRVLMQNPAIFILDEATASVDPFTEWQIQQALNLILKNATSILIAHRLSTVKAADRIIVMAPRSSAPSQSG